MTYKKNISTYSLPLIKIFDCPIKFVSIVHNLGKTPHCKLSCSVHVGKTCGVLRLLVITKNFIFYKRAPVINGKETSELLKFSRTECGMLVRALTDHWLV